MKTLKNDLYFAFDAIDLPTETERTREKFIQAHKCLKILFTKCYCIGW